MLTSIYIHIPFCDHICTYCDFHKSLARDSKKERYINALVKELKHRENDLVNIKTVYIGGGTPLSLSIPLLHSLLRTVQEVVNLDDVTEYTMETNPNNLSAAKIALLMDYGINRISIGIQTFDSSQLAYLGRDHSIEDVHNGITRLRDAKFPNISVDMIFSLVDQSMDELDHDIDDVLALDVDHISYYSLILEERTLLYHDYQQGKISMASEDLEADMFQRVIDRLTDAGYEHYEISNFAKAGRQSAHNKAYWLNHEYLGFGSGSHSHVSGKRFFHIPKVTSYINQIEQDDWSYYHMEDVDDCVDRLLVGLRLLRGVDLQTYEQDCGIALFDRFPELQEHLDNQLLELVDGRLRLTASGIRLGNIVFMTFLEGS